jgi:DNA replication protein DnaC
MNLIELNRSLVQLRLSGMAAVMETRLLQAQSENMAPIDLISILVSDELACRSKRLLERRHKQAQFRDANKLLDNFDFQFNPKMNRSLVFDLATANWVGKREDALFLGPPGSGKSHCAQAIGHAVIQQGYRVLYREAHRLLEELADATLDGKRKELMEMLTTAPLLIIDDLGMRKLPLTAAEELLEIIMRRYERASTLLTSNRLCGALHNLFNAESIFMRTPQLLDADFCHLVVFLLRIMGVAFSRAISLSVALKRPVRSFGAIADSNASSFTLGSARV